MPKISSETIKVGESDDFIQVTFDIQVNASGKFTTTLSQADASMIESYNVALSTNGRRNGRTGYFESETKADLIKQVKEVLGSCYSRTLIDEKIVIQYAIATTCSFGFTVDGNIVPNMGWSLDGELDQKANWQNGTVETHASNPRPTGIQMYVRASHKRTYKYSSGRTKTEYDNLSSFGGSDVEEDRYYLKYIEALCSQDVPRDAKIREMEYTEERAKFFVEMFKSLCRVAHTVAKFIEPDEIIKLAENGNYLMGSNEEV